MLLRTTQNTLKYIFWYSRCVMGKGSSYNSTIDFSIYAVMSLGQPSASTTCGVLHSPVQSSVVLRLYRMYRQWRLYTRPVALRYLSRHHFSWDISSCGLSHRSIWPSGASSLGTDFLSVVFWYRVRYAMNLESRGTLFRLEWHLAHHGTMNSIAGA